MVKPATAKTQPAGVPEKRGGVAITSADVARWVSDRIRKGRLVPGQRLVEADLVRETGASRTRVREALQRLAGEGLLQIEEFRGASVRRLTRGELDAIYSTRAALEGLAAAEFARQDASDHKRRLADAQRDLDVAVGAGDHDAFARHNDTWHGIIIDGSRNPYIAQFVERLRVPLSRLLYSTFHSRQRIDDANADHRAITRAILAGAADEAEAAMRFHINNGFAALLAQGIEDRSSLPWVP